MKTLSLVVFGIGIFIFVMTILETKKYSRKIEELLKQHKCKEYAYFKKPMTILAIVIIPCVICAIIGFQKGNENLLNLGILTSFLFLTESYRSYFVLRIYYNDEGVIANDKFLKIKSIKNYFRNSKLPFGKWVFLTYGGERLTLVSKLGNFIVENYQNKLPKRK